MKLVKRVSVISTGTVQIRPEHVETNGTPMLWWLNTSRRWTAPRPINVYVIEHEKGLVLFDTGQDRRSVTDPDYFPGGPVGYNYRRLATFDIPEGATLTEQLSADGYDIADVRVAILSHLHQDHIGACASCPIGAGGGERCRTGPGGQAVRGPQRADAGSHPDSWRQLGSGNPATCAGRFSCPVHPRS